MYNIFGKPKTKIRPLPLLNASAWIFKGGVRAYAKCTKISCSGPIMRIQGEGAQWVRTPPPPPEKLQKDIRIPSKTGPDPLRNLKSTCTKPAFNVGPSSAHQRNDGPLIVVYRYFDPPSRHRLKKLSKFHPP